MLEFFKDKILNALPSSMKAEAETFIASVLATISATPALQKCTPQSIALAAYEAATLGLPVNKLGLAYLVPRGNEVKLEIGYRGLIQLVVSTGYVFDVSTEIVYSNDYFKQLLGSKPRIDHEPAQGERGQPIAVYAIARLANGLTKQVVMSKEQVEKIRNTCSANPNGSTWVKHWEEMAKKTAIKRLCKTLPQQGKFGNIVRAIDIDERSPESDFNNSQLLTPAQLRLQKVVVDEAVADEPMDTDDEHYNLCTQITSLHRLILAIDKKAEALPDLPNMTVGDLETLLERKQAHYERIKG